MAQRPEGAPPPEIPGPTRTGPASTWTSKHVSDSKQHVRQQHVRQHSSTSDSSWRLDMRGHWGLRRTSILVSNSSGSTEDPQPGSSSDPGLAGTSQDQDAVAAVPHGG
ncbi:unnamed protein product [Merluccius merluccius]